MHNAMYYLIFDDCEALLEQRETCAEHLLHTHTVDVFTRKHTTAIDKKHSRIFHPCLATSSKGARKSLGGKIKFYLN